MNPSKSTINFLLNFWPIGRFLNWIGRKPPLSAIFHDLFSKKSNHAVMIPINETIQGTSSVVLPYKLLLPLVEQASQRYILNECLCRQAERCQTYPIDVGCLFLGKGAEKIHPSLAKQASVDDVVRHLDRAMQAGLVPLVIHSAFDALVLGIPFRKMLAVCFCCDCCCTVRSGLRIGPPSFWEAVERLPGLEVAVNDRCKGCGLCVEACHVHAIQISDGRASIGERCKGCGNCATICPRQAIEIKIENIAGMSDYLIKRVAERTDIGLP